MSVLLKRFIAPARPVAVADHYSVAVVSDRADFLALEEDWKALERDCGALTAFQTFDWCAKWLETCAFTAHARAKPRIATMRDETGRLVCIFPLCLTRRGPVSFAEWIGQPLIQYGDILLSRSADLHAVRSTLAQSAGMWADISGFRLRKVRDDSAIASLIHLDRYRIGASEQAAIADLSGFENAEAYFATHTSRTRKNRRSRRRKLESKGRITFEVLLPGGEACDICETAIAWKLDWLADRELSSRMFSNQTALDVLADMASSTDRDTGFRAFVLKSDGKPVAIECSFVHRRTIYSFIGAYHPDFESLSVGKLQMEDSIRHAFDADFDCYDLLAPMTSYKESWATRSVCVAEYAVPLDVMGIAYVGGYIRGLRPAAKRLYGMVPERFRDKLVKALS